jgi:copper transport protein
MRLEAATWGVMRRVEAGRHGRRGRAAAVTAVLLLLLLPGVLYAHLYLRSSSPDSGERLDTVPESIQLTFSEPVEIPLSSIGLTGPEGPVAVGGLTAGDLREVVSAPILGRIVPGGYTVSWQAVGRDGHPVRGEFSFQVEEGAEGLPLSEEAEGIPPGAGPPVAPPPAPPMPTFDAQSPLYAGVRWMVFSGILGMVGALGFALLVLGRLPGGAFTGGHTRMRGLRGAANLGTLATLFLVVSVPLRLQAQSHALFGAGVTAERMSLLLSSTWGLAWVVQAIGSVLALAGFLLVRRVGSAGWALAGIGTAAVLVTPALSGHAASATPSPQVAIVADTLHIAGSGVWLGTLLALLLVGIPLLRHEPSAHRGAALFAMVRTFSPVALIAAGVVVATGLLSSWIQLSAVADLWRTEYGRLLFLKLLFVALVFAVGAINWKRIQPRTAEPGGDRRLKQTASIELAATLLVLIVTSVLTAVPPPAQGGIADWLDDPPVTSTSTTAAILNDQEPR